jgi:hypothetical protein
MQLDVKDKDIIMISDIDEIPDLSNVNIFEIIPSHVITKKYIDTLCKCESLEFS